MIWFVYSGQWYLGTVIADTREAALAAAVSKFPLGWQNDWYTVEPRRRKRAKAWAYYPERAPEWDLPEP